MTENKPKSEENKWCIRCKEEFPIAPEGQHLQMGWLFDLERVSEDVKRYLRTHEDKTSNYLCGNCWYDIIDEIEDKEDEEDD